MQKDYSWEQIENKSEVYSKRGLGRIDEINRRAVVWGSSEYKQKVRFLEDLSRSFESRE